MTDKQAAPNWVLKPTPSNSVLARAAKQCGWAYGTDELYHDNPVYGALCDMIVENERLCEVGAKQAFEVGVLREALGWMADSEPLVVDAILSRVNAALAGRGHGE